MKSDTAPSAREKPAGYVVAHEARGVGVVRTKGDGMSVESGGWEGEERPSCTIRYEYAIRGESRTPDYDPE
jgi:hypothetical protein